MGSSAFQKKLESSSKEIIDTYKFDPQDEPAVYTCLLRAYYPKISGVMQDIYAQRTATNDNKFREQAQWMSQLTQQQLLIDKKLIGPPLKNFRTTSKIGSFFLRALSSSSTSPWSNCQSLLNKLNSTDVCHDQLFYLVLSLKSIKHDARKIQGYGGDVNPDMLFPIFVYVLCSSNLSFPHAIVLNIETFLPHLSPSNGPGYALSVLKNALAFV